jgi:hypothetical protein
MRARRRVTIDRQYGVRLRFRDGRFHIDRRRSGTGRVRRVLVPRREGILGIDVDLIGLNWTRPAALVVAVVPEGGPELMRAGPRGPGLGTPGRSRCRRV